MRITRDGWIVGGLSGALSVMAFLSKNNLLYVVASPLWVLWGLGIVWGAWNLRGLSVARVIPPELFADVEAGGRLILRNPRAWLPAVGVELHDDAGARGVVARVPAGGEASVAVRWWWPRRGVARLEPVRLRSSFPFGFVEHVAVVGRAVEVVVYPHPRAVRSGARVGEAPGAEVPGRSRGRDGDFGGLRPYAPGDRPAAIHWPSTARTGHLLVVQGGGEGEPLVDVVVLDRGDRERDLAQAAGELVDAFDRGLRVGLVLPGYDGAPARRFPPSTGAVWRRTLLEALARVGEAR